MEYYVDLELICHALCRLGFKHWERFERSWEWEEIDKSIFYGRISLRLCPEGCPVRFEILNNLGNSLNMRFKQYGRIEDLEEAIEHDRAVLQLCSDAHPHRPGSLSNLAASLHTRFQRHGRFADLDEAIDCNRVALRLCPDGHPDRSVTLNNLAYSLRTRFQQYGRTADLDEAIEHHHTALQLRPEGHPDRSMSLNNLANSLITRFQQSGQAADLDETIEHHRAALLLRPVGHPDRGMSLGNLAASLQTRFDQRGQTDDLNEAIEYQCAALQLRSDGHPDRSMSLNNLANSLITRFEHYGRTADLDEAIKHHHLSLQLRPDGHPDRPMSLNNLAECLEVRFDQQGQSADLDEAIEYHRAALLLVSDRHSGHATSLANLAASLQTRFNQQGQTADLDEAIEYHRTALELHPNGHPSRTASLTNLASSLLTRFQQLGLTADLDEAIEYQRAALHLCPEGHPKRYTPLNNLAASLQNRFRLYGRVADLDEAIEYDITVLQLCPNGHSARSLSLNNLAESLRRRFEQYGQTPDLDDAIEKHRAALLLRPNGHPDRSMSLHNLAACLRTRFIQHGQMTDIDKAIEHHRSALELRPDGHPSRSISLMSLALSLYSRYLQFRLIGDFEECMELLERGAEHKFSSLVMRLDIACQWATLARTHAHCTTSRAYKMVMLLLQRAVTISPTLAGQHDFLQGKSEHGRLALDAAAYAIEENKFKEAIEILEQGRTLLWSLMRGFRTPLECLAEINKQLADKFRNVNCQLENLATLYTVSQPDLAATRRVLSTSTLNMPRERILFEDRLRLKRQLSNEQERLINEIRQTPGFEDFLSATPFKVLQEAASEGPVIVVNHCKYRSDALIVLSRDDLPVVCVQLDEEFYDNSTDLCEELLETRTSFGANSQEYDEILCRTMQFLWDRVVSKLVAKLKELGVAEGARIWWCPTSILSALPFHAAGPFKDLRGTTRYLLDKYISSYTPTLRALINARSGGIRGEPAVGEPVVLIIGDTSLESADKEIRNIRSCCSIRTKVRCNASRDVVINALRKTSWVHFACHGRLKSKPFDSAFKLSDRGLTLLDIVQANLPNAEFAFLSACHTAEQPHDGMHDEVLHLAAAMQFSGFRSVIGSMWELLDVDGPFFAKVVYEHMCNCNEGEARYRHAALGLRKAAVKLKSKGRDEIQTERWVNLVHIGT